MIVADLIEQLQKMPRDADVVTYHCVDCFGDDIGKVVNYEDYVRLEP